jgi:NADH-quinone oxidoreductase subunit L
MTQSLVWLIPGLPLLAFTLLVLGGERLPRMAVTATAVAAAFGSALVAAVVIGVYLVLPPGGGAILQNLGQWIDAAGLSARIALRLDPLSLVMVAVVIVIALLVQSWPGPAAADDHRRHRAGLSLFAGGLLVLLLAENLLLAYLGWELAGLAGFLLVDRGAARPLLLAGRLAAVALLVALLLLFTELGTLHLPTLLARAGAAWSADDPAAVAATALLAGGLVVRVLRAPLQATSANASVGAVVHGAALGAASVYLIARMHALFALAPVVQAALVALGAFMLLGAAGRAVFERDLWRLLGQAALGQTGVMLLALGLGAPTAAVFHFVTHAGAIALLFLAAGLLVAAGAGERDLFRLGGIGRHRPAAALAFTVGAASVGALPLLTAGFYSQVAIVHAALATPFGSPFVWIVVLLGVLLTALSMFRAVFVLLRGERMSAPVGPAPTRAQQGALIVLAIPALAAGLLGMPAALGGFRPLPELLHYVLPAVDSAGALAPLAGAGPMLGQAAAALIGLGLAWWLYRHGGPRVRADGGTSRLLRWGHDLTASAGRLAARPWIAVRDGQHDLADGLHHWFAVIAVWGHRHLYDSQSGRLRAYAIGMVGGVIVLISIVVLP